MVRHIATILMPIIFFTSGCEVLEAVMKPSTKAPQARVNWWQGLKFGMFIHWGPWSQTGKGGIFRGRNRKGDRLPPEQVAEYLDLYKTFNPVKYDPREWARVAREAGMKYVVFTTKHHDGFCNFDTALTDYRSTSPECPYHTNPNADITRALVEAFRKEGLAIGLYYSHPDQHHPDGVWWNRHVDYVPDFVEKYPERWKNFVEFEQGQVRELLTKYGKIDIFWFDISWPKEGQPDAIPMLKMMRKLQPDMIIDNRGTGEYADFITPEQMVPATAPTVPWETCMTISDGGGFWYKGPEAKYKSAEVLIRTLVDVASKGGNFLLNVGPRPDGTLTPEEIQLLKEVGKWMAVNGEAIYGTTASPFKFAPKWGRVTQKRQRLYLIVLDWPKTGEPLQLPLLNKVTTAAFLDGGMPVDFKTDPEGGGVQFMLPAAPPRGFAPVITVDFKGEPQVAVVPRLKASADGSIELRPEDAEIVGTTLRYQPDRDNLGAWIKAKDYAQWCFTSTRDGRYKVELSYGCAGGHAGNTFEIVAGKNKLKCKTADTGGIKTYKPFVLGSISLPADTVTIAVKPVGELKGPLFNFRRLRLIPEE